MKKWYSHRGASVLLLAITQFPSFAHAKATDPYYGVKTAETATVKVIYPVPVSYMNGASRTTMRIELTPQNGAGWPCVSGYRDFRYELRDSAGRLIPPPAPQRVNPAIMPPPDYFGCPWQGKYAFNVRLDILYPKLTPGDYALKIYPALPSLEVEFPQLNLVFADTDTR
jgi:hypothetical protein